MNKAAEYIVCRLRGKSVARLDLPLAMQLEAEPEQAIVDAWKACDDCRSLLDLAERAQPWWLYLHMERKPIQRGLLGETTCESVKIRTLNDAEVSFCWGWSRPEKHCDLARAAFREMDAWAAHVLMRRAEVDRWFDLKFEVRK